MRNVTLLFVLSLAYAVVRYVVFAPKNLDHLPVFIVNKGLSMAAALAFAVGFWQQWRRGRGAADADPATWFRAGVFAAVVHIPLSLAVLRPSYFAEFHAGERLSFLGECVILFGGLTAGGVYLLTRPHWSPRQRWGLSLAAMSVLFLHALCMGLARGLNINRSHAYLPPMWLLSLIGVALGVAFLLAGRPGAGADPTEEPRP